MKTKVGVLQSSQPDVGVLEKDKLETGDEDEYIYYEYGGRKERFKKTKVKKGKG